MRNQAIEAAIIGICVAGATLAIRYALAGAPLLTQFGALLAAGIVIGALQMVLRRLRARRFLPPPPPIAQINEQAPHELDTDLPATPIISANVTTEPQLLDEQGGETIATSPGDTDRR